MVATSDTDKPVPATGSAHDEPLFELLMERAMTLVREAPAVLVAAPEEFLPAQVGRALASRGVRPVIEMPLSQMTSEGTWADGLEESPVLLLETESLPSGTPGAEQALADIVQGYRKVLATAQHHGVCPRVIIVCVTDLPVTPDLDEEFACVLDREALRLGGAELARLTAAWQDVEVRRDVLVGTGGVPALVRAALRDSSPGELLGERAQQHAWAKEARPEGALSTAASRWAARLLDQLVEDPVQLIHAFIPLLSPWSVAEVVRQVASREVSVDDVLLAQRLAPVLEEERGFARMPSVLAAEVVRLTAERSPALAARFRRELVRVAVDADADLPARATISLLVSLRAWGALDEYLAVHGTFLATLSHRERRTLDRLLPESLPAGWIHLHGMRPFLTMDIVGPPQLPQPWLELLWLATRCGSSTDALSDRISTDGMTLLSQLHSPVTQTAIDALDEVISSLQACVTDLLERSSVDYIISNHLFDQGVIVSQLLLGASDAAMGLGRAASAQHLLQMTNQLTETFTIAEVRCPALCLGLSARQALLAAHATMAARARTFLEDLEEKAAHAGAREPEAERIASIARLLIDPYHEQTLTSAEDLDANNQFAPFEIEARGLALLVREGDMAAREWITRYLAHTQWNDLAPVQWWPLRLVLILLDLRQGHAHDAEERVSRTYLPPDAAALVDAELALLAGQPDHCVRIVNELISSGTASPRWVMVAQVLRAGLLTMSAEHERDGLHELTARGRTWSGQPGLVALLPDPPRGRVLENLPSDLSRYPGVKVSNADTPAAVALTPRQREILEYLSRGLTMAQVADELVLGVETVRSTAKAIYKRLGVHDRAAAIQVARLSGELPEPPGVVTEPR